MGLRKMNEEGQSTVEFALTLILLMSVILFFMQLSLVLGFGNYVHYATFMSARALLSAGPDQTDQLDRAKAVIIKTVKGSEVNANRDRYPAIAQGTGGDGDIAGFADNPPPQYAAGVRNSSWLQGVRYTFKSRLFLIPLGGNSPANGASANTLQLTSESWLGREPDEDDCQQQLGKVNGIYDNGC